MGTHDHFMKVKQPLARTCCYCSHVQILKEIPPMSQDPVMTCENCGEKSCPYHARAHFLEKGACLAHEAHLQTSKNMKFIKKTTRTCSNCKHAVHKYSGCNHMTCRCSHQFCYLCGGVWN